MYAAGTDMTKLRYTDTMQLNPLYRPQPDDGRWRQPTADAARSPSGSIAAWFPRPPRGSYSSGKAQSIQQPSQGTPYGGDFTSATPRHAAVSTPWIRRGDPDWRPNSPRRRNGVPVASSVSQNAGIRYAPGSSTAGQGAGNLAYAQPDARPAPFTMQSYDLQGNPVSMQQQQQQRDAFLTRILQQPRSTPQYDFNGMLEEANGMVKDGWQNPFNFNQPQGQWAPPTLPAAPLPQADRVSLAPTPEMVAADAARQRWIAAGSPGYTPERPRLTWEQLNNLPAARARDASGSIGAGLSSTPEYQEAMATQRRNAQAEQRAISQWQGGGAMR